MNTPSTHDDLIERGKSLHRQGRFLEAESIYQQALAFAPQSADALHLLGVLANQRGEYSRAIALIEQAIQRKPDAEHFHCNLGLALMGVGDGERAHCQFLAELAMYPSSHASHVNLGVLLQKQEKLEEAIAHYRTALSVRADDVVALNNLGLAYMALRQFDAASEIAQKSLQILHRNPDAYNLLGLISRQQGRPLAALAHFAEALKLKPDGHEILFNMGVAHKDLSDDDQAFAFYERALQLKPEYPDPHFSRGLLLLAKGEFEAGWRDYEYGLLCGERTSCNRKYPRWRGESIAGRTILCCAEQGLGDEIMFASVLPEVIRQAGHCVVECDARLVPIYKRSFPVATIIPRSHPGAADFQAGLPHVDLQSPMGSLPLYLRKTLADFPRHAGYLKADPERVAYWQARLDALGPGLKVGISWRGGTPKTRLDRRSVPLTDWLPVFKPEGIQFVSLQYTECSAEITALEQVHGIRLEHWQEAIDDYDETAALVSALDLVITVQTAVFHLGGALGRPVWGLLPIPAEWRYMQSGDALPWYPSARLFRQSVRGEWGGVMRTVSEALETYPASVSRP